MAAGFNTGEGLSKNATGRDQSIGRGGGLGAGLALAHLPMSKVAALDGFPHGKLSFWISEPDELDKHCFRHCSIGRPILALDLLRERGKPEHLADGALPLADHPAKLLLGIPVPLHEA